MVDVPPTATARRGSSSEEWTAVFDDVEDCS